MNTKEPQNLWDMLSNSALLRFLLLFASGWALLQILSYFETIILVFTVAAIQAFLLNYPVRWLKRYMPRNMAVLVVFLAGLIILALLAVTVGVSLASQSQQLINSIKGLTDAIAPFSDRVENFLRARNLNVNLQEIEVKLRDQALAGIVVGVAFVQIFFTNLLNLILITVVSFFMLLDGRRLWELVIKVLPKPLQRRLNRIVASNFLKFFQGQLIMMSFLIVSTFIVFLILNVQFSLLLAVIIGIFDLLPGIGATLGIFLVTVIVLAQNAWLALKVFIACIILQQIQDNLIYPRIMQNSLNLHPVIVFFALLLGARAAGVLGVFIAIPLAGVFVDWFEIEEMKGGED